MSLTRIAAYQPDHHEAYARFVARTFGPRAVQGSRAFVAWLSRGRAADVLLATTESGEVVGCMHRLRLPWAIGDDTRDVPALVNLMVAPEHRTGTGLRLFVAGLTGERHAWVPAANDASATMCEKLGWRTAPARWYRRWLRPSLAQVESMVDVHLRQGRRFTPPVTSRLRAPPGFRLESAPGPEILAAVAATLALGPAGALRPRWDAELVGWRFFRGPRHLVLGRPDWGEVALLSIGPRRGLLLGRVVELRARSAAGLAELLAASANVLSRAGAHAVSLLTTDRDTQRWLDAAGWRALPVPPKMFFFHKDRKARFDDFSFGGGAGDFGLEAFVAE